MSRVGVQMPSSKDRRRSSSGAEVSVGDRKRGSCLDSMPQICCATDQPSAPQSPRRVCRAAGRPLGGDRGETTLALP